MRRTIEFTQDEKNRICNWHLGRDARGHRSKTKKPVSTAEIARRLKVPYHRVERFLKSLAPGRAYAEMLVESTLPQHVERITEFANVEQSMEMLHRANILDKRNDTQPQGSSMVVMVGMPGQPALHAPTQAQLDAAKRVEEIDDPVHEAVVVDGVTTADPPDLS